MKKKYIKPDTEVTIVEACDEVLCLSWLRPRKEYEYEPEAGNPWSLTDDDDEALDELDAF